MQCPFSYSYINSAKKVEFEIEMGCHQAVIMQSSYSHQEVIRQSSGSHAFFLTHSTRFWATLYLTLQKKVHMQDEYVFNTGPSQGLKIRGGL
jgi:hypothetical protein